MPTVQEYVAEVKALALELSERVTEADKEQKSRHEDLTSKTATIAAEHKTATDRVNARINELADLISKQQVEAARPPLHGLPFGSKERSDAHRAWMKAIKTRDKGTHLTDAEKALVMPSYMPAEMKSLYASDATSGGYFASTDFLSELLAYRLLVSPMRKVCRIQATSGEKVQMPSLANDTSVVWATEQSSFAGTSNDPSVGMIEIPVHEMRGLLKVSQQNLEDSQFNLEDFMKDRLMKNFAKKEGTAFISGTGSGQPQGLLTYKTVATTTFAGGSAGLNNPTNAIPYVLSGAAAGKINADDVLNVKMDLKADYDPGATYIFTRGTLNTIRLFKDSQNRPLWQPFAGANLPSMIYDTPYIEMPDMQQISSGNFVIAVGDFSYYMIVDRISLAIRELDELYAESGLIGFIARMRVGGQILLPEAFRLLKVN